MKMNQWLVACGIAAALFLNAGNVFAQEEGGLPPGGNGANGGGRRGNFDPAKMQQMMMERIQTELNFTNDTEWNVIQPLIQKVMDARRDIGFGGGMGRMMRPNRDQGNNNNSSSNNRRGGFGQQTSAEAEALQKAIDDNSPAAQLKAALEKYQTAQKAKQTKLTIAQENLRKVLTPKQEAQATLLGLLD